MRISIVIIALWVIVPLACRFIFKRRISDIIPNDTLRFWIGFVLVAAIIWLNRYSLMAMPILMLTGSSFGEAAGLAFTTDNNVTFFIGRMYEIAAGQGREIPRYLDISLVQVKEGTAGLFDLIGDLFELILYILQ
ncbi:MAG: hypothetical protein FWH02_05950 [Oscillospiraceae bacterium]|nr:hypothetical protein [Oscillospiraceae bacterium]